VRRRWDIDERGHGVASAESAVPDLDRLRAAMLEPDWVTEDPEAHLLPHVQRLCAAGYWQLDRSAVVDGVLEVDVAAPRTPTATPRAVAFAVLGTFAEASTHVVEESTDVGRVVQLLATTGMLEGDGVFAPHGHTVRIRVRVVD
jgi:hypothetical protein